MQKNYRKKSSENNEKKKKAKDDFEQLTMDKIVKLRPKLSFWKPKKQGRKQEKLKANKRRKRK